MTNCAHYVPLIGAREGELTAEERAALDRHLAGCAACRAREADARALGPLLRDALMAEANRRDFAPFVDGVMERIQSKSGVGERARRKDPLSPRAIGERTGLRAAGAREGGGWWQWLLSHRRWAAALVPTLAAATLIVYVQTRHTDPEMALMELTSEGDATMILQTQYGPLVLLGEEHS